MKRKSATAARQVDPILQELYAVKASLNRKAKFNLKVLCAQIRTEAMQRKRGSRRAA